ncbi:DNA-binding transcriptional activator UhpA [Rubripirellula obstinata]|uniref:DNA-binding transcriptional activator UhpA n=1 Tax=Rubripirellula obstinata TaxID=406547 RepID=A0A5B1CLW8_9BACT|nr:PAS and helix-turn-helix domain-containing protein [Rubripirellula obstinata]KAA1261526.1 DNA-binding transcriptional activator UhpA [Rubripirellula obstinata]
MSPPTRVSSGAQKNRVDPPQIDPASLWAALSQTKGVGVSITDSEGRLLFVNDTAKVLFSESVDVDYQGKFIRDFHSAEYVTERLAMIARVLAEERPLAMRHIYRGKKIHSTVWPIRDAKPPFSRVVVISRGESGHDHGGVPETAELIDTEFIDLGPLNALTRREVEVAVLLGHGMSVPRVATLLHRSPKTIQRHKDSISKKLDVHGQAELVAIITEMGLELDDAKLKRLPPS